MTAVDDIDLLEMRWEDVLFAHWPVAPETVAARLPAGLRPDRHDGRAWLSVVAFRMADIGPTRLPIGLSFPELNLRTYVRHAATDTPGVYFFSLDAADRVAAAIARRGFGLAYHDAEARIERADGREDEVDRVRFRSRRRSSPPLGFDATYAPAGEPFRAAARPSSRFLLERYRFFADARSGLVAGAIAHDPWTVRPASATIARNDCFRANGFDDPTETPDLHYARTLTVRAGRPRSARRDADPAARRLDGRTADGRPRRVAAAASGQSGSI